MVCYQKEHFLIVTERSITVVPVVLQQINESPGENIDFYQDFHHTAILFSRMSLKNIYEGLMFLLKFLEHVMNFLTFYNIFVSIIDLAEYATNPVMPMFIKIYIK